MAIRLTESRLRQIIREEMKLVSTSRQSAQARRMSEAMGNPYSDDAGDDPGEGRLLDDVAILKVYLPRIDDASFAKAQRLLGRATDYYGDSKVPAALLQLTGMSKFRSFAAQVQQTVAMDESGFTLHSMEQDANNLIIDFVSEIPNRVLEIENACRAAGLKCKRLDDFSNPM